MATQFMPRLGIDPEKLYRAPFICQDGLCCCNMALISFRLFIKNYIFLGKWFTPPPPPWQKISRRNKYRSRTIHNMKNYIFSYNNISTIRALLIAVRCKKGFHEIICHSDVLLVTVDTTASPVLCIVFFLLV